MPVPNMQLPPQWRWKFDRWKEQAGSLFSGKREDARPKICPACGTLVGATATKCHECGTSMTYSMAALGKSIGALFPEESPVTYFMLGLNFMLFVVTVMASAQRGGGFSLFGSINGNVLYQLGARNTLAIVWGHELWRLVLPMFLHGGLIHIGMNMMWLKDMGPHLEEVYGSPRFLFLYMATGISGFIWTTCWSLLRGNIYGIGIGASGAMMGLLGLALAITTRRGGAYMQMMRSQFIKSALFVLLIGLIIPFIDNAAHIGGFVSGFLLGRVFADRLPANTQERRRAFALGWLGAILIVGSFAAAMLQFFTTQPNP